MLIDFQTSPKEYRHWRLDIEGDIATLTMDVDENGGLFEGCLLKLNSYDLGVDIELFDAVMRLRFEHPHVKCVILQSGKERVFCAGANIKMLNAASHQHKVNFCKFTNETRNTIENSSTDSGQPYLCAIDGTAAGGGYELALATDHIMLIDDRNSTVSLPETPLLAVLPGTGGLTRLTDKRLVRRDLADVFCTTEEGIKGKRALSWKLVDEISPKSKWPERVQAQAKAMAAASLKPDTLSAEDGVELTALTREISAEALTYSTLSVTIDRPLGCATIDVAGPTDTPPAEDTKAMQQGPEFWPLRFARELDDAILHMRANEPEIGLLIFKTHGEASAVLAYDALMEAHKDHWFINEVRHYLKLVFKRIDLTSRSLIALIEPGSCFVGTLAELVFAADRTMMLEGTFEGDTKPAATLMLSTANFEPYVMSNGLTRLGTRFLNDDAHIAELEDTIGQSLEAEEAEELGLVTQVFDEYDWEDEVRIIIEERVSFSPDALVGMEANLRFPGPETMETKIFGRLTAWQNWIFQRPNAVGDEGALKRYGTGIRPTYDRKRV